MPISYVADIRSLFRAKDVSSMKNFGAFDLSLYEDVKANADAILQQLEAGSMPCDGAWSAENICKFRDWIADGKLP